MIHIKFCGLTNCEDALAAIAKGADLLGFNFYAPSPRSIRVEACRQILAVLRPTLVEQGVKTVGVFVNHPPEQVHQIMDALQLDLAQFSGDESPEQVLALAGRGYKALRAKVGRALMEQAESYVAQTSPPCPPPRHGEGGEPLPRSPHIEEGGDLLPLSPRVGERGGWGVREVLCPSLLLDAAVPGQYGGTGRTADWALAARLAQRYPLLLAGGLRPENVGQAITAVHPWGVDIASGIESSPGKKDPLKMAALVQAVREAIRDANTAS